MSVDATSNRVEITGIGIVSPVAIGAEATWERVRKGQSGLSRIRSFDPSPYSCQVGGEVALAPTDDEPRALTYARAAADEAIAGASLDLDSLGARLGLVMATHGARVSLVDICASLNNDDDEQSLAFLETQAIHHLVASWFAEYARGGPAIGLATACSSGAMAILEACRLIKSGRCDAVLVVGTDGVVNEIELMAFCALDVLSTFNDSPSTSSRPFDRHRRGFVMAEGAGAIVIERAGRAAGRSLQPIAGIGGAGATVATNHITATSPDGSDQAEAMRRALVSAGRNPAEVDYINAHGTGTPDNDESEALAIQRLLGDRTGRIPTTSTKGCTGHMIAAAGIVEASFCALAIRDGVVPPNTGLFELDPKCRHLWVPTVEQAIEPRVCISNSFGLAGSNVALVVEEAS